MMKNSFWRSVIYDFDCSDSLIYDLKRFVNNVILAHEIIDTFNDFLLIEKYDIMWINNRINEKNPKMFLNNIVYVSFIDVIFMFVIRLKKQEYV